jgi:hypothetical protein
VDPITLVAIIGAGSGSPVLLSLLNGRQIRKGKEQDYARQDAVAAKAEAAAERASVAAEGIRVANEHVASETRQTNKKLDVIHALVNSQMTAAIQSELDATEREVVLMREIIGINSAAGRNPTEDSMVAVKATEERIRELRVTLKERHRQDEIAQAQTLVDQQ